MTRRRIIILGVGALILTAVGIWSLLFTRFVHVPTGAMANTILPGDSIVVDRLFGEIKRGDVITFKYPQDPSVQYVSRVIGLPGEIIEIRGTSVYINSEELSEQRTIVDSESEPGPLREISTEGNGGYRVFYYSRDLSHDDDSSMLPLTEMNSLLRGNPELQIPIGHYFVMGDNRDNSHDSRYWGTVARELITGKPYLIYWSVEGKGTSGQRTRWRRVFSKLK